MAAQQVDFDAETAKWIRGTGPLPRLTLQHVEDGRYDYKQLIYTFKHSAKRRGLPAWSAPLEAYLMLMQPTNFSKEERRKRGVGHEDQTAPQTQRRFQRALICTRTAGEHGTDISTPLAKRWHQQAQRQDTDGLLAADPRFLPVLAMPVQGRHHRGAEVGQAILAELLARLLAASQARGPNRS